MVIVDDVTTVWRWHEDGAVGGPVFPRAASVSERSTDEACMVQVPGTGFLLQGLKGYVL